MEQASGSFMTGTRAFFAHFCGPLLLFGSSSTKAIITFQVNAGVSYLLDFVEDIYNGPLCPCFNP